MDDTTATLVQLSLVGIARTKPPRKSQPRAADKAPHLERLHECRRRINAGCAGDHGPGPVVAGFALKCWIACPDCPVDAARRAGR